MSVAAVCRVHVQRDGAGRDRRRGDSSVARRRAASGRDSAGSDRSRSGEPPTSSTRSGHGPVAPASDRAPDRRTPRSGAAAVPAPGRRWRGSHIPVPRAQRPRQRIGPRHSRHCPSQPTTLDVRQQTLLPGSSPRMRNST
jgi:hypothetical protein